MFKDPVPPLRRRTIEDMALAGLVLPAAGIRSVPAVELLQEHHAANLGGDCS